MFEFPCRPLRTRQGFPFRKEPAVLGNPRRPKMFRELSDKRRLSGRLRPDEYDALRQSRLCARHKIPPIPIRVASDLRPRYRNGFPRPVDEDMLRPHETRVSVAIVLRREDEIGAEPERSKRMVCPHPGVVVVPDIRDNHDPYIRKCHLDPTTTLLRRNNLIAPIADEYRHLVGLIHRPTNEKSVSLVKRIELSDNQSAHHTAPTPFPSGATPARAIFRLHVARHVRSPFVARTRKIR
jgi:hypothetical protein